MKTRKQISYYLLAILFLASMFSCRPRYLRCGKKRYCDTNKTQKVVPVKTTTTDFATCK